MPLFLTLTIKVSKKYIRVCEYVDFMLKKKFFIPLFFSLGKQFAARSVKIHF